MDNWQDWNVVQWSKPPTKKDTQNGVVASNDRFAESRIKKLDDVNDAEHVERCSLTLQKQIQQARLAKQLSQKDLANSINVTARVIQDYENGKAVPTPQVLQKLRRVLGVKLNSK